MSEEQTLELSDEQREQVRQMLSKFSTAKTSQAQQIQLQKEDTIANDPDPLETADPGATIEWSKLTPKTRRYVGPIFIYIIIFKKVQTML